MKADPDGEETGMEDVILNNEREHHWRMIFEYNGRGMDYDK